MFNIDKKSRLYKGVEYAGKKIILAYEFVIELFDGVIVYDDPYRIKGVHNLEDKALLILEEYLKVSEQREIPGIDEFFVEQQVLAKNKSWKSFPLVVYGNEFVNNTALCPHTRNALMQIEGFRSAMFSILSAHQEIPPHRGPFKGLLRIHLGLIVPKEDTKSCYIEVGGVRREWVAGKCMMFDDTHVHAAYNQTNEDRVVLFIDILRPLPLILDFFNRLIFKLIANSPFITEVLNKYKGFGNDKYSKLKL